MARGRMLSKSLSTSGRRGRLHEACGEPCPHCGGSLAEFAEALYMLLLAHADDFGRQHGDVFTVQHAIDPIARRSAADFERALQALADAGLIVRYRDEAHELIAIVDFDAHQIGLHKRTESAYPAPPSGKFPEIQEIQASRARVELNLTEQNLSTSNRRSRVDAADAAKKKPPGRPNPPRRRSGSSSRTPSPTRIPNRSGPRN